MNKNLLFTFIWCFFSITIFAQNTLQLNINHKLGENDFALNQASENNLGNFFMVSRLEYYISEIVITHDGGMETALEDVYLLVDAPETTTFELGDYPISEVENISFHIGVDPDANHSDPVSYPSEHPLAPTFPSMHWGWAAGYRFVAFEGKSGSQNNQQTMEFHCLGDSNYWLSEIPVTTSAHNNVVTINLDADCNKLLEGIDVSAGVINHSETGEVKEVMTNFRDFVFTPTPVDTTVVMGIEDLNNVNEMALYPIPSVDVLNMTFTLDEAQTMNISISNVLGQTIVAVPQRDFVQGKNLISINTQDFVDGLYFINVETKEQLASQRFVVNK